MAWTDTHCHLQYEGLPTDALDRAAAAGVTRVVCVGTDAAQSRAAIEVAAAHPGRVWATVGLHPHQATDGLDDLLPLLDAPGVVGPGLVGPGLVGPGLVGIGECGLDYHYDHSPRDVQRAAFAAQVALARIHDLTLVIHTREAWDDTFSILDVEGVPDRTVFHCFTGGPAEARRALAVGAYLSFSGIVTFKKADDLRAAAAMCPADRLLVESDAPYLAPVPHRGRVNEPAYVPLVGAVVASAQGVEVDQIEAVTWENATRAFRLG